MEAIVYSTFRNHLKDYMKKVNDEFKLVNAEKSRIINEKEIWKYFFEKPKKNYNKYKRKLQQY